MEHVMGIVLALGLSILIQGPPQSGRIPGGVSYDVQGKGPVVVLITGSNLDRRMWQAEAKWLKPHYTVVRYDLRAHGQSEAPTVSFSHVDDLLALLDTLAIARATLIGLSAGSTIALDTAIQSPGRVERLVLVAPAISGYVPKERPPFFADLVSALQGRDYTRAQEVMLASPLFEVPAGARALVRAMVTENDRLWTVPRELMRAASPPAVERLESVQAPTLVLVGDRDLPAQREQADILARRIAGARASVVPGGGHMLNLTSPDEFRRAVLEFLGRPTSLP
jgi:pimeloyl-ACP methyl ester carboxylesterase